MLRSTNHQPSPLNPTLRKASLTAIAALLSVASLSLTSAPRNTVESRLLTTSADSGHSAPIANNLAAANNFIASAIAIRHWPKAEILVRVIPSATDDKTPEQVMQAVADGLNLWNGRFKTVNLKLTNAADADIQIGFVQAGSLPGGAVGKTDTQFDPDTDEIAHASIRINERMPQAQLVQAVGHEMGHALGIQGHSTDKNDLMYPFAHLPVTVTDRDLNTLASGYAHPAAADAAAPSTTIAATH